ncbi:hypothetical protein [Microbacterium stercoris]|uniref:DUF4352 domain-containing protein n=1 Tax=Microbacterium stercoris TaxID=2820289 RepID=A0A939TWF9_9MICO|nr:hypothetical protein [Microbacterium stercoris]MBO3662612.1 hypothetical protein [Microbacterium stercoris]
MTRPMVWLAAIGVAAAACVLTAVTPHQHLVYGTRAASLPFDLPLEVGGGAVTGRTFSASLPEVRLAKAIETDEGTIEGDYVIVDLVAEATGADPRAAFGRVELLVGARTYYAVSHIDGTLDDTKLHAGLPLRGSVVFEIAPDDLDAHATLRLVPDVEEGFDDRVVAELDLGAIEVSPMERVERAAWAS